MKHFILSRLNPTEVTNEIATSAIQAPASVSKYEINSYYYDAVGFIKTVEIKVMPKTKLSLIPLQPHEVKAHVNKGFVIIAFEMGAKSVAEVYNFAVENDPNMYKYTILACSLGFLLCNVETVHTYPKGVEEIDVYTLED